jgi:UDP-N-acetylglucosamine transferase subunit ALG13
MKICLVCSSGGHLTEALEISNIFQINQSFLITYDEKFLNDKLYENIFYNKFLIKNYINDKIDAYYFLKIFYFFIHMINVTISELKIIYKENPDVIISTGSEIAIPIFIFAKIIGKKTIYIESFCRVFSLSGTGKILYNIVDLFLVQWDILTIKYKKAKFFGNVLGVSPSDQDQQKDNYIFVSVGTSPFERLIKYVDEIAKILNYKIIVQKGRTKYTPKNIDYIEFTKNENFVQLLKKAKIIISHAGAGSIILSLKNNDNFIFVPRLKKFHEANDNHQIEICQILKQYEIAEYVLNLNDLTTLIDIKMNKNKMKSNKINISLNNLLIDNIQKYLNSLKY